MRKLDFVKAMVLGAGLPALISAAPVSAQLSPTAQGVSLPALTSVTAFYDTHRAQPIWFRNGVNPALVAQLTAILQRATFDGLAAGPQLAAQVQAAAAQAGSGRPEDIDNAEHTLSSAWVQYVQAIKKPTTGMIYAYPVLQPQGSRADQILLTAAAAPSLESYVATTARVNPIYAQLRDTAWSQAQASGNLTPDPRLLANLDRVRSLPATGRFLLVDSGTSMLTLFDNGQQIDSMKVITGTNELPTPLIASVM